MSLKKQKEETVDMDQQVTNTKSNADILLKHLSTSISEAMPYMSTYEILGVLSIVQATIEGTVHMVVREAQDAGAE